MVNVDLENEQDDLYALLVVPILKVIGGFCAYIIRQYRDRILYQMLFRFLECIVGEKMIHQSHKLKLRVQIRPLLKEGLQIQILLRV